MKHRQSASLGSSRPSPIPAPSAAASSGKLAPSTTLRSSSKYDRLGEDGVEDLDLDRDLDDIAEELEMGRRGASGNRNGSTGGAGGAGAYSQLPNGGPGPRKWSGSTAAAAGVSRWSKLTKWQRSALVLSAILLLGFLFSRPASDDNDPSRHSQSEVGWREDAAQGGTPVNLPGQAQNTPNAIKTGRPTTGKAPWHDRPVDSSTTSQCILAPGKPETQYALMIDAGSTGSRMHVYTFSNCLPPGIKPDSPAAADALPTLKDELFYPITPGLSSYKGNPRAAAESLTELMQKAYNAVPKSEHACTPVAVKATAGLRLLGARESQEILDEVESWLKREWPFHVVDDGVVIMDGKDEGVYAWITINYVSCDLSSCRVVSQLVSLAYRSSDVLTLVAPTSKQLSGLVGPGHGKGASAAVMDLGGASTQIVFEPSFPTNAKLSPGDHVYDLSFAGADHVLYQHSHLGYGLMQARRSVHNLVAFTWVWQSVTKGKHKEWADLTERDEIPNPCLVKDGRKTVLLDPPGRPAVNVTFIGTGGGFEACRRVVDVVMAKDALCDVEPCAFGGVYQPRLMETFGSGPIYALSYFYDRIVPLGLGKDAKPFTISELRELSVDVCAGPNPSDGPTASSSSKGWTRFKGNLEAMAELDDRPEYCLDLSFMYSLLSLGYELADERELITDKKIHDIELGW